MSEFQSMALKDSKEPIAKRLNFAEKLRKQKKSDILKGKRDELKKKSVEASGVGAGELVEGSKLIGVSQDEEPKPAVDMSELF